MFNGGITLNIIIEITPKPLGKIPNLNHHRPSSISCPAPTVSLYLSSLVYTANIVSGLIMCRADTMYTYN